MNSLRLVKNNPGTESIYYSSSAGRAARPFRLDGGVPDGVRPGEQDPADGEEENAAGDWCLMGVPIHDAE
jgi:hypothetical protein